MNKRYELAFIFYLILSSFILYIEKDSPSIYFYLFILDVIPTLLLIYIYIQNSFKPILLKDFLLFILIINPRIGEAIVFLTVDGSFHKPYFIFLNAACYLLLLFYFLLIYRIQGAKLFSFTKKDFYRVYPMAIIVFLLFGLIFLRKIPKTLTAPIMLSETLLCILLIHIVNRPIKGNRYTYGIVGGIGLLFTTFFYLLNLLFEENPTYFFIQRFCAFLGLFYLIKSLLPETYLKKNDVFL